MARHVVLSTKKLSSSIIERASKEDIEIIEQEAIQIKSIWSKEKFTEIAQYFTHDYVVFTSANAATIVHDYLLAYHSFTTLPWKIFSLSGKTKDLILDLKHFPKNIIKEATNAADLAKEIILHGVNEIVFFCGTKRREVLPQILKEAGVTVHEVIVYETVETPMIVTEDIDAVLFFSPSAVHSFFSVNQLKKDTVCFAIGQTTATAVAEFTDNKIITSERPSQEMMFASLQLYFQNKACYD